MGLQRYSAANSGLTVQQGGQNRTRVGHIGVVEELERAGGMAAAVAIGGHHDDRQVGRLRFDSRSKVSSFIPGVLMSDRRSAPAGPHSIASRGERSEEPNVFLFQTAKSVASFFGAAGFRSFT
jgi:hypothetical protein